jgi:hypothetical protein
MDLRGIGSTVRRRWQRCAVVGPPSKNFSLQSSGVTTAPADTATAARSICQ